MFNVLLVEDDLGSAQIARILLESPPGRFCVVWVETLRAAREELQRCQFDVVLLDLILPDGDGRALLTEIQTRLPRIPVIVMSSSDDVQTVTELVRMGADDFIGKGSIATPVAFQIHISNVIGKRADFREAFEKASECINSKGMGLVLPAELINSSNITEKGACA